MTQNTPYEVSARRAQESLRSKGFKIPAKAILPAKKLAKMIVKAQGRTWPGEMQRATAKAIVRSYADREGALLNPHPRLQTKAIPKYFYASREWKELRYEAIRVNGGKCQCCGRSPLDHGIVLHVDHIKPKSLFPKLAFELSNLQVLCEDCNIGKCNYDSTDWRPAHLRVVGE